MGKLFALTVLATAALCMAARAETTECMEITAVPAVITKQGIHCFKQDFGTAITSGNAIEIQTNNVTIDMNGYKLGGLAAGAGTMANGIYAEGKKNITIRNGTIRGFHSGILLTVVGGVISENSSGHLIEDIRADGNRLNGIAAIGYNIVIQKTYVIDTGSSDVEDHAYGIFVAGFNIRVENNMVNDVSETMEATGIYLHLMSNAYINNNQIFEINSSTSDYGIAVSGASMNMSVSNNQIYNSSSTASTGIIDTDDSSEGLDCIGNVVRGYTKSQTGCDYLSGNHFDS